MVKEIKKEKSKIRIILVVLFIAVFTLFNYISLRGRYLEYKELGENFINVFITNTRYNYIITGVNFILLYIIFYFTTRGIKKGLKAFSEKEDKVLPKLPNKSISLIISAIVSVIMGNVIMKQLLLCIGNTSFEITDPIFNLDISYYMFQKPLIEMLLYYLGGIILGISIYSVLYYIIVFNMCFDGVDSKMLKQSAFIKKLIRNVRIIAVIIACITLLKTQDILFNKMITIIDNIEIIGAGFTESTIQLFGYIIFSILIVISIWLASINIMKNNNKKVIANLVAIPIYLVVLFLVIIIFNTIFVGSNKFDKEKKYIAYNIENTKNAYNIKIEELNLTNSGTITEQEVNDNSDLIKNIPIVSKESVINTLKNNKTETGYYLYRNANIAKYNIEGKDMLLYVAPREISNSGRTYNNKTYEYTHGNGQILISASKVDESGNIQYIQKDIEGKDEVLKTTNRQIYYGLETNQIVVTNAKDKQEYDYTDNNGKDITNTYNGKSGLQLGLADKFILGITKGDINLAVSSNVKKDSKILINRNIIERAKKALPYLIYDTAPYTVVSKEGKIIWVLDAYTVSNKYPYSQNTVIYQNGIRQNINYIRNSVKVLIDSYDGTVDYYITDRNDPIAMAYFKIYPTLFKDIDKEIPEDISEQFVYPQYLYDIQSEILKIYHNEKPDILYRANDLWKYAKYNNSKSSKSTGTQLESYYTMLKTNDEEPYLGLVQIYTPNEKQNLISYLVGKTEKGNNVLKLYKFAEDSNIVGPMQLDKQIEEDKAISAELNTLNVTGTKVTKRMIIVPVNNTLLYVEAIYQTMANESDIPILKKIVVASGNKVAIGNNLEAALKNLLSKEAVDIEIENTEDIEGLIKAIIKANNNLTQSSNNNNWEMMGQDINKLQSLIKSLEEIKEKENKKKEQNLDNTNIVNDEEKELIDETKNQVTQTNKNLNSNISK
ncbi:MAG: UPF0182 family protein [Clostridia bacterium]|nr:UPF0182 family protein [Clostridia bacterium]